MASKTIKQIARTLTGTTEIDLYSGSTEGEDLYGSYQVPYSLLKDKFNEGVVTYVGTWNATTNSPDLTGSTSLVKGQYWVVSVSGTTTLG